MTAQTTYTNWLDVKDYASVTVTVKTSDNGDTPYSAPLTLIWGQGVNDEPPYNPNLVGDTLNDETTDMVAFDAMPSMGPRDVQTRQYDIRARWLMFKSEKTTDMSDIFYSYQLKGFPTEIKIKEDHDYLNITNNCAHVTLADACGNSIDKNNGLFVHLADGSNNSIDSINRTLAVSVMDACNNVIDSTKGANRHILNNVIHTDLVLMLSRDYSMNGVAMTRAFTALNGIINGIKNYTTETSRVTLVSYGRLDISTTEAIGQTLDHPSEFEPPDRTIVPGVIEYQGLIKDFNNFNSYTVNNAQFNTTNITAQHHIHTDTAITLLVPGNNIYTTIVKLFDGNVGNNRPLISQTSRPTNLVLLENARKVLVVLTPREFDDFDVNIDGDNITTYGAGGNNYATRGKELLYNNFGDDIYVYYLRSTIPSSIYQFPNPTGNLGTTSIISATNTRSNNARLIAYPADTPTQPAINTTTQSLITTIFGSEYIGKNALNTVISNNIGIQQASTMNIVGAKFQGKALYYALSDNIGNIYSTTKSDVSTNSMFVHFSDSEGKSISYSNPLPISALLNRSNVVNTFDKQVDSSMTMIHNTSLKLTSLGISNEGPTTIWLKVYNIDTFNVNSTTVFTSYTNNIIFNIPIPANEYRDIYMPSGIALNGLYLRISDSFAYDSSYYNLANYNVIVSGTYY